MQRIACRGLLPLLALFVGACASTTLKDSWFDSSYNRGAFKKWLVVGVGANAVARRTLEDVLVARLRQRGAQALPGFQYLADGKVAEGQLDGAVVVSGADGLMLIRLSGLQTRTQVTTAMVPGPMAPGFGWYGMYSTWYAVPEVSQYQVATVETSVFEVYEKKMIWTGVTETFDPASVAREAPGFAELIVGTLAQRGLVPPSK